MSGTVTGDEDDRLSVKIAESELRRGRPKGCIDFYLLNILQSIDALNTAAANDSDLCLSHNFSYSVKNYDNGFYEKLQVDWLNLNREDIMV